jgi:DNA-binding NarL/FixJ family response regulator
VEAEADLSRAADLMGPEPPAGLGVHVHLAVAEHAAWRGAIHRGRQAVDDGFALAAGSEDHLAMLALAGAGLRLEADAADVARARRIGAEATDALERGLMLHGRAAIAASRLSGLAMLSGRITAETARVKAERARLEGEPDAAAWRALVAARDGQREPFESAYARWRLGEVLLHTRKERGPAEQALRTAFADAARMGAAGLVNEIETVARRARIDLLPTAPSKPEAVAASPAVRLGLSERELEVLALVADGRSNREIGQTLFITEKTAGHHVSNILGKLGVGTRVEAAAVAHRAGVVE